MKTIGLILWIFGILIFRYSLHNITIFIELTDPRRRWLIALGSINKCFFFVYSGVHDSRLSFHHSHILRQICLLCAPEIAGHGQLVCTGWLQWGREDEEKHEAVCQWGWWGDPVVLVGGLVGFERVRYLFLIFANPADIICWCKVCWLWFGK